MNVEELKKNFNETLMNFIEKCIPLDIGEHEIYFISNQKLGTTEKSQLYGFDKRRNIIFEPIAANKNKLINKSMELYFTDDVKKNLENKVGINFTDLCELTLKNNYLDKYVAKKFFYHCGRHVIYVWNMIHNEWEVTDEVETFRHLFVNSSDIPNDIISFSSNKSTNYTLDSLGVKFDDLDELSYRAKDGCIHYINKKTQKMYTLNLIKNQWYLTPEIYIKNIKSNMKNNSIKINNIDTISDENTDSSDESDTEIKTNQKLNSEINHSKKPINSLSTDI